MKKWLHSYYLTLLLLISFVSGAIIFINGFFYYTSPLEKRALQKEHEALKPGGKVGHGLGIIGTSMIVIGVISYSSRKRLKMLSTVGNIRDWLNLHIFLCLTGPILVLFHTTFKFSGIAGASLWSMISVVLSGITGRYIYIQIPKGLKGNELTAIELEEIRKEIQGEIIKEFKELNSNILNAIDEIITFKKPEKESTLNIILSLLIDDLIGRRKKFSQLKKLLKGCGLKGKNLKHLMKLEEQRYLIIRRTILLDTLRQIFKYWHVIHLPFTLIMFILLAVHVLVAFILGYRWLF